MCGQEWGDRCDDQAAAAHITLSLPLRRTLTGRQSWADWLADWRAGWRMGQDEGIEGAAGFLAHPVLAEVGAPGRPAGSGVCVRAPERRVRERRWQMRYSAALCNG